MSDPRPPLETRTKIVATLGPASWDPERLVELIDAGVDVFRINCSHADHDAIRRQVARVRRAAADRARPIAILLDLQGPKIRTGVIDPPIVLSPGDVLTVVMDEDVDGQGTRVGTTYTGMVHDVKAGDRVLFADGALSGTVSATRPEPSPGEVDIRIVDGGPLGSHKGINLPGVDVSVPSLSEKDEEDVAVGLDVGVDYVAMSFVRTAEDVRRLRGVMGERGADVPIVAKIEKPEALHHLDEILAAADGVMVARGDLGVEVPLECVPVHQKTILQRAAALGKIAITATQMLDSMERNPRPTRAETTDVANAIFDGSDAVMLSGETSVGRFPVDAVRTMDAIARAAEQSPFFRPTPLSQLPPLGGPAGAACRAACHAVSEAPRPLLVFTWSGATARFVSRLRPPGPIYAMSPNLGVVDRLALVWGVVAFHLPRVQTVEEMTTHGLNELLARGLVRPGDEIVLLAGNTPRQESATFVKFHVVGE